MNVDEELDKILLWLYQKACIDKKWDMSYLKSYTIRATKDRNKAKSALKKLINETRHEQRHQQRHQPLGVSRWISVGEEYDYWKHPMTLKKARNFKEGKDI